MQLFPSSFEAILFSLAVLLWVLSEIVGGAIVPWLRRSGEDVKKKDNGSVLVIRVLMYASVLVAMFMTIKNIAMLPDWLFYPGIVLIVAGVFVRQWAILTLGRFFTTTVGVQKNQTVVETGLYHYIRHPSYLGVLIIMLGIGFALHSWGGIIVLLAINGLALGYRINLEEKVLVAELGEDYIRYMKRTRKLIPFVF